MSSVISNLCYLVFQFPGGVWRAVKSLFKNSIPKWWYSHYR
jgi:hypothetical protein